MGEIRGMRDEKSTLRAINKYLSEVESNNVPANSTTHPKRVALSNVQTDIVSNYRRKLHLQPS
jgi:hypothetical protein